MQRTEPADGVIDVCQRLEDREEDGSQGNLSGLPLVPALQKHAERGPQSQLKDAAQRRSNASGAFSVLPGADVSGKTLLLIDDIVTTGATLSECCRVLKGAGAARVDCAAFASPRNENER